MLYPYKSSLDEGEMIAFSVDGKTLSRPWDLNVYGTRRLKVADLSMVPENVGANTNNTALAIGEKAAIIIERLAMHVLS
jgi:hypothetical protein